MPEKLKKKKVMFNETNEIEGGLGLCCVIFSQKGWGVITVDYRGVDYIGGKNVKSD